jgi:hypothetical protein
MKFGEEPPPNLSTMADGGVPATLLPPRETTTGAAVAAPAMAAAVRPKETSVNALVVWIDYADADDKWPLTLSTGPGAHQQPTAWSQGVWFLDEPLPLPIDHGDDSSDSSMAGAGQAGTIASVNASLDTLSGNLKVEVVPNAQQR